MQVAFFSNCDCDSVTVATLLPFYFFTFLPFSSFPCNRLQFLGSI